MDIKNLTPEEKEVLRKQFLEEEKRFIQLVM